MFLVFIATKTLKRKCIKWFCECGFQVFLEPFSFVLGQSKSKQVLISVAQSDTRHLNCLHRLGIVLGIMDWVKDYQKKLEPSCNPHTAPVEQANVRIHLEITVWMSHFIYSCQDIFFTFYLFSQTWWILRAAVSRLWMQQKILRKTFWTAVLSPPNKTQAYTRVTISILVLHHKHISTFCTLIISYFSELYLTEFFLSVNGEEDLEPTEEEEGEELYELLPNGETSDVSSDANEKSEMPDCKGSNAASWQTENTLNLQRSIIEDIRSVLITSPLRIIFCHIVLSWPRRTILVSFSPDRKHEFGIGVELNAESQKLMQVQQERLGRSLDRLSTELYSKDTHFVLELIQVASTVFSFPKTTQNRVCQLMLFFVSFIIMNLNWSFNFKS